ncbi:MAG: DNA repair protein RecN [Ignavibacteriae bacterium]|nr:DNA repair protein RecN [Ignavibacteriota bacterium]
MLKSLYIKNYALIEEISVEFGSGLNIITGETGAGKSILIDALSLILGARATSDEVRKGEEKAIVEGIFGIAENKKLKALLAANEIEVSDELILRREVSAKGQSRNFINDTPAPLAVMKEAGELLVDLHGQHEHQSLLRTATHIEFLDDFGGLEGLVAEYRKAYSALKDLFGQLEELSQKEKQLKEKRDLYEFQLKEIDAVSPQPGEEDGLESELKILENSEKLFEATSQLHQMLYEGDNALYGQLVLARNQLQDLVEIDKSFEEMQKECASAAAIISEVTKFIQAYNAKVEFNPERLEQIRERLGQLSLLKKKYGGSVDSIIEHQEKIAKEFQLAENFEGEIKKLSEQIDRARKTCSDAAQRLSTKRQELVGKINKAVVAELSKLGIQSGKFDVTIQQKPMGRENGEDVRKRAFVKMGKDFYEATPNGIDTVEFYISTNAGEDPKPLAKVASGGEISRIMLALKTILAKSERLPLLIFDEIDVGVSGRIAQAVGRSLKALSQFHQVIAITHLPQIAGLADMHFAIEKTEDKKRTRTRLRALELEERVEEVAKLMSGAEVTEAGLEGARELMGLKK